MAMAGLLWYDDDNRRPLMAKILEAVERYSERVGRAPTVCQLPPQQMTALTDAIAHRSKRARKPILELPRNLRLESDEHLQANYFILGMGEDDIVLPNPLLDADDAGYAGNVCKARRTASRKHRAPTVAETPVRAAKMPRVRVSHKSPSAAAPVAEQTTPKQPPRVKAPTVKAPTVKAPAVKAPAAAKPIKEKTPVSAPRITQVALFADEPATTAAVGKSAKRTRKPRVAAPVAEVEVPPTRTGARKAPPSKSPAPSENTRKAADKKATTTTLIAPKVTGKTAKTPPAARAPKPKAATPPVVTATEPQAARKSPARKPAQATEKTRASNRKTKPTENVPAARPGKKTGGAARSAKSHSTTSSTSNVHEQVADQLASRRRTKTLAKSA